MLAWDRLRWLRDPFKMRLPSFVCGCGTWLAGLIIALPYPIYTTYIDLGVSWIFIILIQTQKLI